MPQVPESTSAPAPSPTRSPEETQAVLQTHKAALLSAGASGPLASILSGENLPVPQVAQEEEGEPSPALPGI